MRHFFQQSFVQTLLVSLLSLCCHAQPAQCSLWCFSRTAFLENQKQLVAPEGTGCRELKPGSPEVKTPSNPMYAIAPAGESQLVECSTARCEDNNQRTCLSPVTCPQGCVCSVQKNKKQGFLKSLIGSQDIFSLELVLSDHNFTHSASYATKTFRLKDCLENSTWMIHRQLLYE